MLHAKKTNKYFITLIYSWATSVVIRHRRKLVCVTSSKIRFELIFSLRVLSLRFASFQGSFRKLQTLGCSQSHTRIVVNSKLVFVVWHQLKYQKFRKFINNLKIFAKWNKIILLNASCVKCLGYNFYDWPQKMSCTFVYCRNAVNANIYDNGISLRSIVARCMVLMQFKNYITSRSKTKRIALIKLHSTTRNIHQAGVTLMYFFSLQLSR
jgi:hypothetical protein